MSFFSFLSLFFLLLTITGFLFFFFFQAEDGIRDLTVTGVQTCALPIFTSRVARRARRARRAFPVSSGAALRATRAWCRGGNSRAPTAPRGHAVKYVLLAAAVLATLAAALLLGPANVPLRDLLASPIVWQLRLPRAVLAFLVGGALGVSGVALQALVRNPLADPFLLGLSGRAGLGAVVAI